MAIVPPTAFIVTKLEKSSLIERDAVETTWCYKAPDNPQQADYELWAALYHNFLQNLSAYAPNNLATGTDTLTCTFFLLPQNKGPMGAPVAVVKRSPGAFSNSTPLPNEVAVCLSLEGNMTGIPERGPGGTRPASRRRNRKYLGPWGVSALGFDAASKEPEPLALLRETILSSYQNELVNGARGAGWIPYVFSRVEWTTHPVERAWVDNAWDTQRRRGNDPTIKTSHPV